MNDYNNAQIDYRERCKARIQRQLEISKFKVIVIGIDVLVSFRCCINVSHYSRRFFCCFVSIFFFQVIHNVLILNARSIFFDIFPLNVVFMFFFPFFVVTAQFSYLTHYFTIVMGTYNTVQIDHREKCKERIARQLEISKYIESGRY